MVLQREVAPVDEVHLRAADRPPEGLRARGHEDPVVPAPDREHGRLARAEVPLEHGVQRHVRAVVEDEVELDVAVAGPREERLVEGVRLGRDARGVRFARGVLRAGGCVSAAIGGWGWMGGRTCDLVVSGVVSHRRDSRTAGVWVSQ